MREKLLLLSRILFSPPNLRVSGGLPLLLGGSLHHHGGSPLTRGGVSPPRSGSVLDVVPYLLHRHTPTSTVTLPHQQPHPRRSPHPALSSSIHPFPFSSEVLCKTHNHNQNPFLKTKQMHPVAAESKPARLLRVLFRLPQSTTAPPRPPPETPPSASVTVAGNLYAAVRLWSSATPFLRVSLALSLFAGLFPLRPPRKPPWSQYEFVSLWRFNLVYGAAKACLRSLLLFNNSNTCGAPHLFDKRPHKLSGLFCFLFWFCWYITVSVEAYVASTLCFNLSNYLSAIEYQGNWLNPENKISRNVPFRSQKSSGLDLEEKTRVSLFVIIKDWERKLLIVRLLDWRDWFVYVPIVYQQSRSCDHNVYVVFVDLMILGCGWEMSQHICSHSSCNVDLVSIE